MAAQGLLAAADKYITSKPKITYFNPKYEEADDSLKKTFELPFDNSQIYLGTTSRCTIPAYGDLLTGLTLKTTLPAIFNPQTGTYVYPSVPSQVSSGLYVQMPITQAVGNGTTLTVTTSKTHFFSVGASITLSTVSGTYVIATVPTPTTFTCSTSVVVSVSSGTVTTLGMLPAPIVNYYTTINYDLWVNTPVVTPTYGKITDNGNNTLTISTGGYTTGTTVNLQVFPIPSINQNYQVISSTSTSYTINKNFTLDYALAVGVGKTFSYSTDGGINWKLTNICQTVFNPSSVAYNGSVFVSVGFNSSTYLYSTDGANWITKTASVSFSYVISNSSTTFYAFNTTTAYSSTDGLTWTTLAATPVYITIFVNNPPDNKIAVVSAVAVGTTIVLSGLDSTSKTIVVYSTNGGSSWTTVPGIFTYTPSTFTYGIYGVGYLNNSKYIIALGQDITPYTNYVYYSTNGSTWNTGTITGAPALSASFMPSIVYGNSKYNLYVAGSQYTSLDGITWTVVAGQPVNGGSGCIIYFNSYFIDAAYSGGITISTDGFNFSNPTTIDQVPYVYVISFRINPTALTFYNPLTVTYDTSKIGFTFSSLYYSSIYFANGTDAAFWGFDYRQGPQSFVNGSVSSNWTLPQGGWIGGISPVFNSQYNESVGNLLITDYNFYIGNQTINKFNGQYIDLLEDITVPYENQTILKLLTGKFDSTAAIASRTYYSPIPLGCDSIPLSALGRQSVSLDLSFNTLGNLTSLSNFVTNSGNIFDKNSYKTINIGRTINVVSTLSIDYHVFFATTSGDIYSYNTVSNTYVYMSTGANNIYTMANIGDTIYFQTASGKLLYGSVTQFNLGNFTGFTLNNYLPAATVGLPTGTMAASARYLYYTQLYASGYGVYMTRYDTVAATYSSFDFSSNIYPIIGVNKILYTGSQLYLIPHVSNQALFVHTISSAFGGSTWAAIQNTLFKIVNDGVYLNSNIYYMCDNYKMFVYNIPTATYTTNSGTLFQTSNSFVSFGHNSTTYYVMKSINGITLTSNPNITVGVTAPQGFIYYLNNLYILTCQSFVNLSGFIYTSTDATTWTQVGTAPAVSIGFIGGVYARAVFSAAFTQSYNFSWSTDLITWNAATIPASPTQGTQSQIPIPIVAGGGIIVAGFNSSTGSSVDFWWTSDAKTWNFGQTVLVGSASDPFPSIRYLNYGTGGFVACTGATVNTVPPSVGSLIYSANGKTGWTVVGIADVTFAYYGNNLWIAGTGNGLIYWANPANLSVWTLATIIPTSVQNLGVCYSGSYANGIYTMLNFYGEQLYSYDGKTWYYSNSNKANFWYQTVSGPISGQTSYPWNTVGDYYYMNFSNMATDGQNIYFSVSRPTSGLYAKGQAAVYRYNPNLSPALASSYTWFSSTGNSSTSQPVPITFDTSSTLFAPKLFGFNTNSIFMFTQDSSSTTTPTSFIIYNTLNTAPVYSFSASILADYKVLSGKKPSSAMMRIIQPVQTKTMYNLGLKNPVKELWLLGVSNAYQYSNISTPVTLNITHNEYLLTSDVGNSTFLGIIGPYEAHSTMPQRNFYQIPFEYMPEKETPNGTINFSRLDYQAMSNVTSVWARSYNVLTIKDGVAGLMFNS